MKLLTHLASAIAAWLCLGVFIVHAFGQNVSDQKPHELRKVIVLYKSGVSNEDKSRVHTILNGKVTTTFSDPTTEEVTVTIPADQDSAKYMERVLKAANKDPAVVSAYKSPTYKIE